jgi:hypothetical protein
MIRIGDPAPEAPLVATDGAVRTLADWRGRPVLAVFLRWLG